MLGTVLRRRCCAIERQLNLCLLNRRALDQRLSSTTNAGTWPPPDVTFARPLLLRRVRKPATRPAEDVRREVHQHVAHLDSVRRSVHHREHFAADGNAALRDPCPRRVGQGLRDGPVPRRFVRLPPENHAGPAVFVVRLDHVIVASPAQVVEQRPPRAVDIGRAVGAMRRVHGTCCPTTARSAAVIRSIVRRVGQQGKERLLVRHFAAEGVGDAHRPGRVRRDEGAALVRARDDVVDEDAPVDEVDALSAAAEHGAVERRDRAGRRRPS